MKNYGTDIVTKASLDRLAENQSIELDAVDQRQSKQILALQRIVYSMAAVNLAISLVLLVKVFG